MRLAAAGTPVSTSPRWAPAGGSPRLSAPGWPRPSRLPWTRGGRRRRSPRSPAPAPIARSPYAVLAARLSPAELPAPHARSARPPWCGACDDVTRMLGFDGDAPWPCPRCKPQLAATRHTTPAETAVLAQARPGSVPARRHRVLLPAQTGTPEGSHRPACLAGNARTAPAAEGARTCRRFSRLIGELA
jgi:hypothetical protein